MDWKEQLERIKRGGVDVITEDELIAKLKGGTPLRVKYGIDPTSPHVHLGHTVPIRKLRQFQDLGHQAVLIIGDSTAQIGDPSEKDQTRPQLSPTQVQRNARDYIKQIGKILDISKTEVVHNSHWFSKMSFHDALRLGSELTINRAIERDAFEKRFKAGNPIFLHELMYCLMQGYDSVMVRADVELGGTDQTYNLLVGRDLQKGVAMTPQVCITFPILVGTDGTQRMGKSLGNYIGVSDHPKEMFGKLMSIPDDVMPNYFELLTDVLKEESAALLAPGKNPRDAKLRLAETIVAEFHSPSEALQAKDDFIRVFSQRQLPEEIPEFPITDAALNASGTVWLPTIMTQSGFAQSNSQAIRLIQQGAVTLDGVRITDSNQQIAPIDLDGKILKVGKRRFRRLRLPR